jgi:hypothetical protein
LIVTGSGDPDPNTIYHYLRKEDKPMGVKKTSRVLSVLIAVVMIMTSAIAVFAVESPVRGLTTIGKVKENKVVGQLEVITQGKDVQYKVNGGSYKTLTGDLITGLNTGDKVIVKNEYGDKNYRWMKTVKVTQKKKGAKVTWNKVSGATGYQIQITDKNGKVTRKTLGKNTRSYKVKAGCKVRVRPLKKIKSSGNTYMGIQCMTYTVK